MSRISYVNGRYVPHDQAAVHVEDRGFQFADGVYEVMAICNGRLCHLEQHLDRLGRSLGALAIAWPVPRRVLVHLLSEVVRRNRLGSGVAYLQVTRGPARRNHAFPVSATPSLVITAWSQPSPNDRLVERGVGIVIRPDQRWHRPDIKTVGLLPNALARQSAKEAGAFEAWMVDARGVVTEGAATNAFIVARDGALLTHPQDSRILAGITRANVIGIARADGLEVGERPFTLDELKTAREAFMTGTTMTVMPVISADGAIIGNGCPGPVTMRLRELYARLRQP